jgi:signal peptidase I
VFYFALLLAFLVFLRQYLAIITVYGRRMEPTLFPGDRVLLLRLRLRRLLQPGQLVVCQYPQIALLKLSQRFGSIAHRRPYRLPANKYNGQNSAQSERLAQFP